MHNNHRTYLTVANGYEVLSGDEVPWTFRPHFHATDELVHIISGRARLSLKNGAVDVRAGDRIVVPAGQVHRFEPVDSCGWRFVSSFYMVSAQQAPAMALVDSLSQRAIASLLSRPTLQTDVESVARACDVSAGYLSRIFRRSMGTSLHNYHVLLALACAKQFLIDGCAVVDAALEAGFYDQGHLTREFVRTYGLTPGAYKAAWYQSR